MRLLSKTISHSLYLFLVTLVLAACSRNDTENPSYAPSAGKTWPVTGEVVSKNPERSSLLVAHDEIAGFMPAMTMEFIVSAGDLANASAGQRIRGKLRQEGAIFHLEEIWPADVATQRTVEAAQKALRQDTVIRGKNPYREVGEAAPEFALLDQDGRLVEASRFRGRRIVLNFIFSRCPVADMCPAATQRMLALQRAAKAELIENLELISVTLDPVYDTPGVLKEYAASRGIDTQNFSFLTGPEPAVKDLMAQLGVTAFPSDGLIKHSMATLLINESGKIVHREDGTLWDIEQFLGRLRRKSSP